MPRSIARVNEWNGIGAIMAIDPHSPRFEGVAISGAPMEGERGGDFRYALASYHPDDVVGIPILLDHRKEAEAVVGVVEAAWREGEALHVIGRLAATQRAKQVLVAIRSGCLRGLSMGHHAEEAHMEGGSAVTTRLVPLELSICWRGWDAGAKITSAPRDPARLVDAVQKWRAEREERIAAERSAEDAERFAGRLRYVQGIGRYLAQDLGIDPARTDAAALRFVQDTTPPATGAADARITP